MFKFLLRGIRSLDLFDPKMCGVATRGLANLFAKLCGHSLICCCIHEHACTQTVLTVLPTPRL